MEWEDHIGCQHDPKVIRRNELTAYIDGEKAKHAKLRAKRDAAKGAAAKAIISKEIAKGVAELKPYNAQRADVNKTISKNPMCACRKYRFLKEPRGVLPTVIQNLLDARKHTRKVDMKKCYNELDSLKDDPIGNAEKIKELNSLVNVLDKRQLAYKVSCNSMYGAMGVRRGYLPFMAGAMTTTFMGRVNIEKVADIIPKKFGGELVYGDTDSNYIHFPLLKTAQETWDHALFVAAELTKMFPAPIVLEFEEEIYAFFLILSKKRYMYRKCLRDGVVDMKIGKKGVLLARRDNSKFVRDVYERVVEMIADNFTKEDVIDYLLNELNIMCSACRPPADFVVTKAVGDCGNLEVNESEGVDEKGKVKVGEYKVPNLPPEGSNGFIEALEKKGAINKEEYYLLCMPAQVQLAERMKRRGQRVDTGERLEYVITDPDNHTAKQYEKVECVNYLSKHKDIIKIDYFYYLKALANPMDQLLEGAFTDIKDFMLSQYNFRYKVRNKLLTELKSLSTPVLQFEKIPLTKMTKLK